ncbi:MAG: hypothetical protein WCA20_23890 [Candidatus Sulfotelmatobacter sp.]
MRGIRTLKIVTDNIRAVDLTTLRRPSVKPTDPKTEELRTSYVLERKALGSLSLAAVYFFEVEYTTAVKGLPHSKQLAFNRDVINPQDGHILCDPYPATCGFSLRIL